MQSAGNEIRRIARKKREEREKILAEQTKGNQAIYQQETTGVLVAGAFIATTNTLETEVNNENDPLSRNRGQDLRDQLSSTGGIGDANMSGSMADNFKTDISKVRLNVTDTNSASGIPRIEKIKLDNIPN